MWFVIFINYENLKNPKKAFVFLNMERDWWIHEAQKDIAATEIE